MKNNIDWVLEYKRFMRCPWEIDYIMGHASREDVFKKGRRLVTETGGLSRARAVNRFTRETIGIIPGIA